MSIKHHGEVFQGYNKPKRTRNHKTKSHAVLAKNSEGKVKLVRFGQQGKTGAGKSPKTAKDKARKKSFYARHSAQNPQGLKNKHSALYWSARVKW